MPRAVILRHDLPDGTWHLDALFARSRAPGGALLSFRVSERLDLAPLGSIVPAVRLPDHRADYLDYEGEISGGRGRVSCEARGVCRVVTDSPTAVILLTKWGPGARRILGEPAPSAGPDAWQLRVG